MVPGGSTGSIAINTKTPYLRGFPAIYRLETSPMLEFGYFKAKSHNYKFINPTFDDPKLPIFGNTSRISGSLTPNHRANVAAY